MPMVGTAEDTDAALTPRLVLASPRVHLQVLLLAALAIGGGGVAYGLHNLVIQLVALATLGYHSGLVREFFVTAPRVLKALVIASLALPLLQLVPIPPSLWQALPGRELVTESLELAGLDLQVWAPLSLDPARTLVAFCGTLAPATLIIVGSMIAPDQQRLLAHTAVAGALGVLLWGAVQLASANSMGMLYPIRPAADVLYATFANRNSTGLVFVIGIILLAMAPFGSSRGWLLARVGAGGLLALGVVLTQSRSAIILLALAIGFVVLRAVFAMARNRSAAAPRVSPQAAAGFFLAIGFVAILVFSAAAGGRVAESFERFGTLETDRLEMWDDGVFAAEQYWPVGSGLGTFDEVFQVHESLEYISPRKAGRAHNDFIELAIEGGIPALLLAAAWLGWIAFAALRRGSGSSGWLRLGAGLGLGCIALQSILDYPLRNQAILCVAAVLVVLLMQRERRQ